MLCLVLSFMCVVVVVVEQHTQLLLVSKILKVLSFFQGDITHTSFFLLSFDRLSNKRASLLGL